MKPESRLRIEQAAYELIEEFGYDGISMLKIAKRAKASNETLYKWYGDKKGLFSVLVETNTTQIKQLIGDAIVENRQIEETLDELGYMLLGILLGDRAIALNKAAIADPSGDLGTALAKSGRDVVFPMICQIFQTYLDRHTDIKSDADKIAEIYLRLLIGDLQIRRATGAIPMLTSQEIHHRSEDAQQLIMNLISGA